MCAKNSLTIKPPKSIIRNFHTSYYKTIRHLRSIINRHLTFENCGYCVLSFFLKYFRWLFVWSTKYWVFPSLDLYLLLVYIVKCYLRELCLLLGYGKDETFTKNKINYLMKINSTQYFSGMTILQFSLKWILGQDDRLSRHQRISNLKHFQWGILTEVLKSDIWDLSVKE